MSGCSGLCHDQHHPAIAHRLAIVTPYPYEAWLSAVHDAWTAGIDLHLIEQLANQGVHPVRAVEIVTTTTAYELGRLAREWDSMLDAIATEAKLPRRLVLWLAAWIGRVLDLPAEVTYRLRQRKIARAAKWEDAA
jgi:hypothetical protein